MDSHPSRASARARAQERLDDARRQINRAMIDAARERAEYVARASADAPTPEREAARRLHELLRDHQSPQLASLRQRALAWLAEDQATGDRRQATDAADDLEDLDRLMRQKPAPAPKRARRVPLGYVPDCPWRITLSRARLLDLRALGATYREIAQIETISEHTVKATATLLPALLEVETPAEALAAWRAWCSTTRRTPEPALTDALAFLRGRHLSAEMFQLMPPQWALLAQIAAGLTHAAIGAQEGVTESAIKARVAALYRVLGVQRRAEAVAWYWDHRQEQEVSDAG